MRAVTGELTSSNPVSLSKAAAIISRFASSDTDARTDVAAYLRRTCSAFVELVDVHRKIRAHRKRSHFELKEEIKQSSMRKEEGLQEVDGVGFVSENKKRKRSHADEEK